MHILELWDIREHNGNNKLIIDKKSFYKDLWIFNLQLSFQIVFYTLWTSNIITDPLKLKE